MILSKAEVFASLPPVWPEDLLPKIRSWLSKRPRTTVVLDDDPTGTQTVHDIAVLTEWNQGTLDSELKRGGPGFYILTNSRAFSSTDARGMNLEIGRRLARQSNLTVVSRGDSTLRGHFPDEVAALSEGLAGLTEPLPILLCPCFEAGGRFTIRDIHYVAEGDYLVPAGQTPFAADTVFGYRSSNLREWVMEKSRGRLPLSKITSISLDEIRRGGPVVVAKKLQLPPGTICVANAVCRRDLEVIVLAGLVAEERGQRLLYRTAASFVSVRMGQREHSLLSARDLRDDSSVGGLVVVGSHVPKSTEQLSRLITQREIEALELCETDIERTARVMREGLRSGRDVALFTSRQLVKANSQSQNLAIAQRMSNALVEVVSRLDVQPRFFVAKGGITSSDLATRALGVRRALVRGQILPGVPVWQLGGESRFPGMNYVVFPGNVGGPDALVEVVNKLSPRA
jgi:uncharacterized protein YgbK (DUF1537 family)